MRTVSFDDWTLVIDGEAVEVTSFAPVMEPDPDWAHIDARGHLHSWALGSWEDRPAGPPVWCPDCRESHEAPMIQVCTEAPDCGEQIRPGYRVLHPAGARRWIQGQRRAYALSPEGVRYDLTGDEMTTLELVGLEWLPELVASRYV